MHSSLMQICRWVQNTSWATAIRTSLWAYPFIQLIHFSGLSLWLGTIAVADMRLLGVGTRSQTSGQVRDELFVWNWIGFCTVVLGGFLLFGARATMYVINPAFRVKLGILVPTALAWHIFVQWKTPRWAKSLETPAMAKVAGLIELLLWICVVTAAVEIPNY